jgi:hypothetical protein
MNVGKRELTLCIVMPLDGRMWKDNVWESGL